jgi:FkbM family methyltransferase
VLWHPHQKLWNWRLAYAIGRVLRRAPVAAKMANQLLIGADSLLLVARVALRRARSGGPQVQPETVVLYIDCGIHREGLELRTFYGWFGGRVNLQMIGFEAGASQYQDAERNLADIPVDLRRAALVGPDHLAGTVTFYVGGNDRGHSLFPGRGDEVDSVPAVHLSEVIREADVDRIILRMNIEGAEEFVIDDLIANSLTGRVAGFYGMWDDLWKLDAPRDRAFRKKLRANGIEHVTFNDRDLDHRLRRAAIRFDIETSLRKSRPTGT